MVVAILHFQNNYLSKESRTNRRESMSPVLHPSEYFPNQQSHQEPNQEGNEEPQYWRALLSVDEGGQGVDRSALNSGSS